ncbi:MAG: HEAT repeat domain-containing protein [Myxococcota bacterium]|nr:HEAT repeat domain-containing protein [Myxococcota bacterium]
MGTGIVGYFSTWSLASYLISPFEAKRLFPWVSTLAQLGAVSGAILAIISNPLELDIGFFLGLWVAVQCVQVIQGCILLLFESDKKGNTVTRVAALKTQPSEIRSLIDILKAYRFPKRLALLTFLNALLWFAGMSMIATTFEESELDLTSLYGILDLGSALLATFSAVVFYPRILKGVGLGRIYVISSLLVAGVFVLYMGFPILSIGIMLYVGFRVVDGSVFAIAIQNQLTLYPSSERDRIRLISDILAQSAGFFMVGFLFLLPSEILTWVVVALLACFVFISLSAGKYFNADISAFLGGPCYETKSNAIALFDQYESEDCFEKFLDIIRGNYETGLQIEAIETLAKTGNPKALIEILDIIKDNNSRQLTLAAMSYIDTVRTDTLDPFVKFSTMNLLRKVGRENKSNLLRGRALNILLTQHTNEETYNFVLESLEDENSRVVANAIEGLGALNYAGVFRLISRFLEHSDGRVRANTIIALWKSKRLRPKVSSALTEMLESDNPGLVISGVFAAGEIGDKSRIPRLEQYLNSRDQSPGLIKVASIALAKIGALPTERLVELLLHDDPRFASSVAYLCLQLDRRTLNEEVIQTVYNMGPEAREKVGSLFVECGGFCHEQIGLLLGARSDETHHFSVS